jgi:RNA polymerase sigma factor (TIGR02999 family)
MGDSGQARVEVTRLLQEWRSGRKDALERLMPLVYDELHLIASRHMAREWRVSALQTTALVSEAYLKLVGQRDVDWQNRAHFFAIAAQLMRRILVDNARRSQRPKHGAGAVALSLDEMPAVAQTVSIDAVDALALDAALRRLEALDPGQGRIVELRFFGGLTVEETAAVVGVSPATVKREWTLAKGFLYRELTGGSAVD